MSEVRALIERQSRLSRATTRRAPMRWRRREINNVPQRRFFIAMVRDKYAPVYRHRSVEFGAAHDDGDLVTQVLTIVDGDNRVWKALYESRGNPTGPGRSPAAC